MPLSLADMVRQNVASREGNRAVFPPVPVVPGGMHTPPMPMTPEQYERASRAEAETLLQRAGLLTRSGLRAVGQGLSMTVEGLVRVEDAFQATVATAFGKIPLSEYPSYVKSVLGGKRNLPGDEFMRLMVGKDKFDQLSRTTLIPGWVKKLVLPDAWLGEFDATKPWLTLGQASAFGSEMLISPYNLGIFMPAKFFTATRVGRVLAGPALKGKAGLRMGIDPATSVLTYPLRGLAFHAFGRTDTGLGAVLMHFRDPLSIFPEDKFPQLHRMIISGSEDMQKAASEVGEQVLTVFRRHKNLSDTERARIFDHLFSHDVALNDIESTALQDIFREIIMPHWEMLHRSRHNYLRIGDDLMTWNPFVSKDIAKGGEPLLREFVPAIRTFRVYGTGAAKAPSFKNSQRIFLPWKRKLHTVDLTDLAPGQKDPWHALETWASQVRHKTMLEARSPAQGLKGLRKRGLVNLYRPKAENYDDAMRIARNRLDRGVADAVERQALQEFTSLNPNEFAYLTNKLRDFTGHRAGSIEIFFDNVIHRMFGSIEQTIESVAQRTRIGKYLLKRNNGKIGAYGLPQQTKISAITGSITSNIVATTLGFNLASAIKNTSQLLNTAAKEGVPATIRGIYRTVQAFERPYSKRIVGKGIARAAAEIRQDAALKSAFQRVMYDDQLRVFGGRQVHSFAEYSLRPFNAVENLMRGISSNVSVERELTKRGIKSYEAFSRLSAGAKRQIMEIARKDAIDTNFIYGLGGRSHLMMSPLLKMGFSLQSYSWKQTEFIARSLARDGSSAIRLWAMHGAMLDLGDKFLGINAENWLGWGFLPPEGFVPNSPIVETIFNLHGMATATAEGNYREVDAIANRMRYSTRAFIQAFGLDADDPGNAQNAAIAAGIASVTMPVPIVAIGRTMRAVRGFTEGYLDTGTGRSWIPITRADAVKSMFFTLHSQAEDRRLQAMDRKLRAKVDRELDRRTRSFVHALGGQDGESLMAATRAMFLPIPVTFPLSGIQQRAGVGPLPGTWGFVGDESSFFPHPEMIERRIKNLILSKTLAGPVREMMDSGWAMEVLWQPYIQRALTMIEQGAIKGLGTGQ